MNAPSSRIALADLLREEPFHAYSYSYPHKTAYRPLDPPRSLRATWQAESREALFLYLHVPFCEQRCGFCNLFTVAQPQRERIASYLKAVERQAELVAAALAPLRIARVAVGGGTPTFLAADQLERLLRIPLRLGARGVPASVEVSPATADDERLAVLRQAGVTRLSMGVQSFLPEETAAVSRHQDPGLVAAACARIAAVRPAVFNLDLIYGIPGQTAASLERSLAMALASGANELYLYPLYVRPLTIMGRRQTGTADRVALYRYARDWLRARGWRQVSMRMFQAPDQVPLAAPAYRCQDDGMIGLGAGARSYARSLHYASPYAVAQARIRDLILAWTQQTDDELTVIRHGISLDGDEQRRRFAILSLLERGLDGSAYRARFASEAFADLPQLQELEPLGLAAMQRDALVLTEAGVERSDLIGAWLYSDAVRSRMASHVVL